MRSKIPEDLNIHYTIKCMWDYFVLFSSDTKQFLLKVPLPECWESNENDSCKGWLDFMFIVPHRVVKHDDIKDNW